MKWPATSLLPANPKVRGARPTQFGTLLAVQDAFFVLCLVDLVELALDLGASLLHVVALVGRIPIEVNRVEGAGQRVHLLAELVRLCAKLVDLLLQLD